MSRGSSLETAVIIGWSISVRTSISSPGAAERGRRIRGVDIFSLLASGRAAADGHGDKDRGLTHAAIRQIGQYQKLLLLGQADAGEHLGAHQMRRQMEGAEPRR